MSGGFMPMRLDSKRSQSQSQTPPAKKVRHKNKRRDDDEGSGSEYDRDGLHATPIFVYNSDLQNEPSMENGRDIGSARPHPQNSGRKRPSEQDGWEEENQGEGHQEETRPKGRIRARFTMEEEEELASWWEQERFLYIRTMPDYRDCKKKDAAIAAKAVLMNRTPTELKVWMSTTRSRVGRRIEEMRGRQGATKQLSEREVQLRARFAFLRDHIYRQPTRQSNRSVDNVIARPVDEQTWMPWTWSQEQDPRSETGASSSSGSDVGGRGNSVVKQESASSSSVVAGCSEMQTSLNGTQQEELPVNTIQEEAPWQPETVYRTGFERTVGDYANLLEGMLLQIDPADFNRFMIQNLSMVSEYQEMAVERRRGSSAMNNSR